MRIAVLLKQVPDTAATLKLKSDGSGIETEGLEFVISPYDEYALEEALRIKEKQGGGEILVFSLGPERSTKALRSALALGADKAVHLLDAAFEGSDAIATAKALAAALAKFGPFDLVLAGCVAADDGMCAVGSAVAEFLGIPQATEVKKLELAADGKSLTCWSEVESGTAVLELPLPALLTAQKGLNEPRYASLKGIMAAKKKELLVLKPADLGLAAEATGTTGSRTEVLSYEPPPKKQAAGKILKDLEPAEAARELVRLLREEAKVI
ncbi:MAG: electron transfer flavoprotein subunit beta/FixA family protein [Candidatus Riflebacteria bacterium]|nr:electron transfer flavoprotein subunit beta/FixA family protein [Candidatus Riflebacteria bacterium]